MIREFVRALPDLYEPVGGKLLPLIDVDGRPMSDHFSLFTMSTETRDYFAEGRPFPCVLPKYDFYDFDDPLPTPGAYDLAPPRTVRA